MKNRPTYRSHSYKTREYLYNSGYGNISLNRTWTTQTKKEKINNK